MRSTIKGIMFALVWSLSLSNPPPVAAGEREDKAAAYLERIGGKVTRDAKQPGKPVVAVDLGNVEVTDTVLKELVTLTELTSLTLSDGVFDDSRTNRMTAAGLREIARLPKLTSLDLGRPKQIDAELKELAPLKSLTAL